MKINMHWCAFRIHIFKSEPGFVLWLVTLFSHAISWRFFCPFCFFLCDKRPQKQTWHDSAELDCQSVCSRTFNVHIMYIQRLQSQQDNGAGWAYKQHRGDAEEGHIAAHPTLRSVLACLMLHVRVGGVWHAAYSFVHGSRASMQHSLLQLLSRLFTEGFPWGYPWLGRCHHLAGGLTAFGHSDSPYM